jgi:hypothetical protein
LCLSLITVVVELVRDMSFSASSVTCRISRRGAL